MGQTLSSCAPCLSGAQTNEDETPYGGSLRSQFRTLKKGSDGHGKSEGSQGSGQNGIHINENSYESKYKINSYCIVFVLYCVRMCMHTCMYMCKYT